MAIEHMGKWSANKSTPLNLKWFRCPVKVLGVHISYDEKKNNEHNFVLKLRKLKTKLDMWKARDHQIFWISQVNFFYLQPQCT